MKVFTIKLEKFTAICEERTPNIMYVDLEEMEIYSELTEPLEGKNL